MNRNIAPLANLGDHWFPSLRILVCLTLLACHPVSSQDKTEAAAIPDTPLSMRVKQRSVTAVPGTNDKLRVSIDDITRGQVMASISETDGPILVATRTFSPGQTAKFVFHDANYRLKLDSLENHLIGDDFAIFAILLPAKKGTLTEEQRIERLLTRMATLRDAFFLRDGVEYTAADEVKTLKAKWDAMKAEKPTAVQFVEKISPKASEGPNAYNLRFSDLRILPVRSFLEEELAEQEEP